MTHEITYRLHDLGQLPHQDYLRSLEEIRDLLRGWGRITAESHVSKEEPDGYFTVAYDDKDLWDIHEAANETAANLQSYCSEVTFDRPREADLARGMP